MDLFSCKDKSFIRLKNSFISSFALGRLYRFGGGFFCAFSEFVFWGGRFFLLPSFL